VLLLLTQKRDDFLFFKNAASIEFINMESEIDSLNLIPMPNLKVKHVKLAVKITVCNCYQIINKDNSKICLYKVQTNRFQSFFKKLKESKSNNCKILLVK